MIRKCRASRGFIAAQPRVARSEARGAPLIPSLGTSGPALQRGTPTQFNAGNVWGTWAYVHPNSAPLVLMLLVSIIALSRVGVPRITDSRGWRRYFDVGTGAGALCR